ncbi:hypothetical protein RHMOL_Rhmol08G0314300 [Rhododendron molle]|uniref:Uncharacterized protein n=1 Tax=Rhododendron molle TaxID=49168 RepID=A0ACC0MUW2_RHOML|nr:hypothetical protein RHMOL_Rhmol08G0314300 [Rhododendron molle]
MHWVALPPPPTCHKRVGIGFISTPDFDNGIISRFKVMRIPELEKCSRLYTDLSLEIFSSETGEWTDFVISWHEPVFGCFFLCDSAVVCNGMLHWRHVYLNDIFAYDPNKTANYQEFRTILLPKERSNGDYVHLFGESQGHLRYAEFDEVLILEKVLNAFVMPSTNVIDRLEDITVDSVLPVNTAACG